jgi:dTDP-4-dehydrorhamnose reductase
MKRSKKILLTGSTGLLAKGFVETSLDGFEIIGVHLRNYTIDDQRICHKVLNLHDAKAVEDLFKEYRFDCVVHAAGIANVDYIEKHREEGVASNLHITMNVVRACQLYGSHLIYISTNAVFDGNEAPYSEQSPTNPINHYGKIKQTCEEYVSTYMDDYTIVRPILMYGWHYPHCRSNPATWIIERLEKGEIVHMVNDIYENPLYNLQCGEILWQCVRRRPRGIVHAAGGEIVSRYDFALKLADVFGFSKEMIHPVDSSFFPSLVPRPANTSFDTRWIQRELGIIPLTVKAGLELMKAKRDACM